LAFEEAVSKINGQNDKHVQKLGDGNTTCSQPVRFICPGESTKIITLQLKPTNAHNFTELTTMSYSNNSHKFSANKVVRKHVGFGVL
jgi:hypothetical protein